MQKPCIFFDRDGVVNHPPTAARYVRSWEEFKLIPEFFDVLRIVQERGYEAVIVTNQKGVSTGTMRREDVDRIHDNLMEMLDGHGLDLRDIFVCTAGEDTHPHRKPNPGMLLEAAKKHDLDLNRSWMIGDNEKDVEAGRRAGCRTVLVSGSIESPYADFRVADMKELAAFLQDHLEDARAV